MWWVLIIGYVKAAISFALISAIISDRGSLISNTSNMIWSTGSCLSTLEGISSLLLKLNMTVKFDLVFYNSANCSSVNNLYEGFQQPLCNSMSKSLDSIWVLFFSIGVAWFPMFFVICRSEPIVPCSFFSLEAKLVFVYFEWPRQCIYNFYRKIDITCSYVDVSQLLYLTNALYLTFLLLTCLFGGN
jgi:hypothetical protein